MNRMYTSSPAARQSGAILFTSLIFLIVLTMFVLAMVRGGTFEQRMATNARDQQRAFEAAEAMLRDAELVVQSKIAPFDPYRPSQFGTNCVNGLCRNPGANYKWDSVDWGSSGPTRTFATTARQISGLNRQPRYLIEVLTPPLRTSSATQCEDGVVRIVARGEGNGGAVAFLQSTLRFRVYTNLCY